MTIHPFFEIFMTFSLMMGSMIALILMLKVGWYVIRKSDIVPHNDPYAQSDLEERIVSIVEERLRIREFDTAMLLMEKQRLKQLELKELELKVRLCEQRVEG